MASISPVHLARDRAAAGLHLANHRLGDAPRVLVPIQPVDAPPVAGDEPELAVPLRIEERRQEVGTSN